MDGERTSYGQYCPISHALDILGERWSLLIIRDLLVGTTRFNDLARGLPGLSRSLLTKRLRQFERDGLVERLGTRYVLTPAGEALRPVVFGLADWGARFSFAEPDDDEMDAELLVWWMHGRIDTSSWPGKRHVVHIRFSDDRRMFWIVVEAGEPSVCMVDPGFDVDLSLRTDRSTLYQVWLGRRALADAIRAGDVNVDGPKAYTRRLGEVLKLSPVASLVATKQD